MCRLPPPPTQGGLGLGVAPRRGPSRPRRPLPREPAPPAPLLSGSGAPPRWDRRSRCSASKGTSRRGPRCPSEAPAGRLLLFCQRTSGKILTQHREDKIKCLKLKGQIETPGVICSCLHIDEKMRRPGCGGEISPESNAYVCGEQAWLF